MKRTVLFFFLVVSAITAFEYSGYCGNRVSKEKTVNTAISNDDCRQLAEAATKGCFSHACKVWPDDPDKIIIVSHCDTPGKYRYDAEIMIVNRDGKVMSCLYQKDAFEEDSDHVSIGINTARYWLAPGVRAFGVTSSYHTIGKYNEFASSRLRLYIAKGENIVQVMDEIETDSYLYGYEPSQEEEVTCEGQSENNMRKLSIGSRKNNGYADIIVNESASWKELNLVKGKCKESTTKKKRRYILHFDGKAYSIPDELNPRY